MGIKDEIAIKIRMMRKAKGMTQEDLAKAIGQSPSSITMYETGRRTPDYDVLETIADVFNVSIFDLVPSGTEEEELIEIEKNEITELYFSLSSENRMAVRNYMIFLKSQEKH